MNGGNPVEGTPCVSLRLTRPPFAPQKGEGWISVFAGMGYFVCAVV